MSDKTDIIFLSLPFWGIVNPPLGHALLKGSANVAGTKTKCIDLNIDFYRIAKKKHRKFWDLKEGHNYCENKEEVLKFYADFYPIVMKKIQHIAKLKPDEVWITMYNSSSLFTSLFIRDLKKVAPGVRIRLGGPRIWEFKREQEKDSELKWFEAYPEAYSISPGMEGEWLFKENLCADDGLYVKKLDNIPFADFSDFDQWKYSYYGSLPTYFTRGCPNNCIYCQEKFLLGGRFRSRLGTRVYDEIVYQLEQYPATFFFQFRDSCSNGNIKELLHFCRLMIISGLNRKVKWSMGDVCVRKEMIDLYPVMKEAGCYHLGFGLETPVHRLLEGVGKYLSKGVDLDQIVKGAYDAGIKTTWNFMFGLPGETAQDFDETLDFLKRNHKYMWEINPALLYCGFLPGSDGWREPDKYGIDLTHPVTWSSKDGYNTHWLRSRRFKWFVDLAEVLGKRNLFAGIDCPVISESDLYYSKDVAVFGSNEKFRFAILKSILFFIRNTLKSKVRRIYFWWKTVE